MPYFSELLKLRTSLLRLGYKMVFNFRNSIGRFLINNSPVLDSGGVYIINCFDCDLCYVGETLKSLPTRISQHKYCMRTFDKNNSIFYHAFHNNHRTDWSSSQFIFRSKDKNLLRFVEAVFILSKPTFNRGPASVSVEEDFKNAALLVLLRLLEVVKFSRFNSYFLSFSSNLKKAFRIGK